MHLKSVLSCLLALTATAAFGYAQNPFVPVDDPFAKEGSKREPPPLLGFLVEWLTLDHTTANGLVQKHVIKGNPAELREAVQVLLDSGEAELTESTFLNIQDGQRAKIESIEEVIYPTEYEPASTPEIPKGESPPLVIATPTVFDVRNVGTTIEFDPKITSDGESIDLNLAPEIVQYLGDRPHGDPEHPIEEHAAIRQPDFFTKRVSSSITIKDGETVLVAVLTPNPKTHPDKRVFLFVLGRILR